MSKKIQWPKLPMAFKRKWVEALRSGEYKQGKGQLRIKGGDGTPTKYCCLGVVGELCKVKGMKNSCFLQIGGEMRGLSNVPKILVLPKKGAAEGTLSDYLAKMNDGNGDYNTKGKSFKQIANWINKNL